MAEIKRDVNPPVGSSALAGFLFWPLVRRYVVDHFGYAKPHRFLLRGDANLDEGNIREATG